MFAIFWSRRHNPDATRHPVSSRRNVYAESRNDMNNESPMEEKDELLEGIASGKLMLTRASIEALLRMRRERQRKKKASK
jgi:hypothetical protein